MKRPDKAGAVLADADKTAWPLLPSERTWGPWRLGVSLVTASAATWCYIIGEYVGSYLRFRAGIAALLAGSMIGMLLVALAAGPVCLRVGVDSIASTKPQFGSRGWIGPAGMQFVSIVGWNSLLVIFFAKSVTQLCLALKIADARHAAYLLPGSVLCVSALVFLFLLRGSSGVDRVARVLVAHVLVGLWMLYILLSNRWNELAHAVPAAASTNATWNYTTGVEVGVVSLLSWWPYLGAMVRMAPSGRKAALPIMLGMGAPVPILSAIGIAGILVLKVSDPAAWLRTVGGPGYGILALLFVAAANLGTAVTGVYASSIGLRHIPALAKLSWPALLGLSIVPVAAVGLVIPDLFFAHFGAFLAFIGLGFAPLCGIQIADYYLLRRRRINVRGLFDGSPSGAYRYWGGVNPAALAGMAAGFATYLYLLNPTTYASHAPYEYLTASLPTALAGALVYVAATLLVVKPAGKGDYA